MHPDRRAVAWGFVVADRWVDLAASIGRALDSGKTISVRTLEAKLN